MKFESSTKHALSEAQRDLIAMRGQPESNAQLAAAHDIELAALNNQTIIHHMLSEYDVDSESLERYNKS